eukprot:1295974-Rhodomonas_salina.1
MEQDHNEKDGAGLQDKDGAGAGRHEDEGGTGAECTGPASSLVATSTPSARVSSHRWSAAAYSILALPGPL